MNLPFTSLVAADGLGNDDIAGLAFAFFVICVSFAIPIVAIVTSHRAKMQREKGRQELIKLALEKGHPIPPELLAADGGGLPELLERLKDPNKPMRVGLILIAVGIALYFGLGGSRGEERAWWALMPGLIGVAMLVTWVLEKAQRPK